MGININNQADQITTDSGILSHSDTGGFIVARGDNVTQKPSATGNNGLIRYNTTNNKLEAIINGSYVNLTAASDITNFLNKTGDSMTGVLGLVAGTSSTPSLTFSSDTATGLYQPGTGYLSFVTAASERLRIDNSGNVGIGTISTSNRLSVVQAGSTQAYFGSTGSNNAVVALDNAAGSQSVTLAFNDAGSQKWLLTKSTSNQFQLYDSVSTKTVIGAVASGNLTLGQSQLFYIDSTGLVSIGNTTPSTYQLKVSQAGSNQAYFGSTGSNASVVVIDNAAGSQGSVLALKNAGAFKWNIYNTSTNTFTVYDVVGGTNFISAATGGSILLGASQGFAITNTGSIGINNGSPRCSFDISTTDAIILPVGSQSQRPGTPVNGMMRYSTTINSFEGYVNNAWSPVGGVPTGGVVALASTSVPTGFLECNGAAISRTTYSTLYSVINTIYGVGDGSTTFNLPDLRGTTVRGYDDGRGLDPGRSFGTYQGDAYASHNHTASVSDPGHTHSTNVSDPGHWHYVNAGMYGSGSGGADLNPQHGVNGATTTTVTTGVSVSVNGSTTGISVSTGASGSSETRAKNVALMYCIKY